MSANAVTVAAVVLSFFTGRLIALYPRAKWPLLVVPAGLFLRMALNAIDGMLAREHGMKTELGAWRRREISQTGNEAAQRRA